MTFSVPCSSKAPYEGGWIAKLKLADESELSKLLDAEAYTKVAEADQD